jgi:hypothetical protein
MLPGCQVRSDALVPRFAELSSQGAQLLQGVAPLLAEEVALSHRLEELVVAKRLADVLQGMTQGIATAVASETRDLDCERAVWGGIAAQAEVTMSIYGYIRGSGGASRLRQKRLPPCRRRAKTIRTSPRF